jgi:hypothetical protein
LTVDLAKTAAFDVDVSFLFGLEVTLKASFLNDVLEATMKDSLACVWFGVGVSAGLAWTLLIQTRELALT